MEQIIVRHPDGTTALLTSRARTKYYAVRGGYGGDNRKKCHALNLPLGRPNRRLREDLYP